MSSLTPSTWRSLEELAQTPSFQELVAREFAVPLPSEADLPARREFLKLMAASLALAGITGCAQPPGEKIVPYVRAPEEIVPGKPLYYATALTLGGYARGVLVESHMGRPTKIEGNPEHPASLGATDCFMQAAILGLYDPDRSQTVMYRSRISTWDHFLTQISTKLEGLKSNEGRGLSILTETVTSPTLTAQLKSLREQMPQLKWHQYEPFGRDHAFEGARLAFGRYVETVYNFDQADVIVSLDSDFLIELPGSLRYTRDFIDRRRAADGAKKPNRLYVAESTPSCTGAMADHRLRLRPGDIVRLAHALASRLGAQEGGENSTIPGVGEPFLRTLVEDLQLARGRCLVIAGESQPPIVHALAHAMNRALENVGKTVQYLEPAVADPVNQRASLRELVDEMQAERVNMLVILGGNPVYNTPGELNFEAALANVPLRIHLSEYYDETSFLCDWHLPAAHTLESWTDARAFDGTTTISQPLIEPLYEGRTPHELLSVLQGHADRSAYQILEEHWQEVLGKDDFSRKWRKALHDGVVPDTRSPEVNVPWQFRPADELARSTNLELVIRPDPTIYDGRFANNGWLQELPNPLTKITWDNALLVSKATADELDLVHQELAEVAVGERKLSAPVWIMPGHAHGCVTLTAGYGRKMAGKVGSGVGVNVYPLRPASHGWAVPKVTLRPLGQPYALASTQIHHNMEGRDLVRVATFKEFEHDPDHFKHGHAHVDLDASFYPEHKYDGNAWGMVIDQTACIGCNACVVACQAENNIPVVGKEQVAVGREMHWIRIDRYYAGDVEEPATYFQPLLCMHCELAPCEVVCPVAATVHSAEGLNDMVYNRCVGTRYCSNNCPYKVRRFNYLQYTDEQTPSLKLLRNPDVTVRSRGVMEKCTYCVQRINLARIDAKKEDREIRDGEVVTACQAACPARAITFGNINDSESHVKRLKENPLNYSLLTELNTKPRTTYLARLTNPHPDLSNES